MPSPHTPGFPFGLTPARLHPSSSPPTPSDYTPLAYGIYVILAVASIVAFVTTMRATRSMANAHLRLLLRVLPISVCWSFAPCGSVGYWWPAPCAVLFGFTPEQRLTGIGMMAAGTAVLYATFALMRLARRLASG